MVKYPFEVVFIGDIAILAFGRWEREAGLSIILLVPAAGKCVDIFDVREVSCVRMGEESSKMRRKLEYSCRKAGKKGEKVA